MTTRQTIGLQGNAGHSTAPHLHFVLIDSPDPSTVASLPLVLDRNTLAGEITPATFTAVATGSGSLVPLGTPRQEMASLPNGNTAVDFP